jgi:uncharacterized protein YbcV (DUF1398 family)
MNNSKEKLQTAIKYALENRPKVGGFPFLAECLRQAGVKRNIWTLPSAQSVYLMEDGHLVQLGDPIVTGLIDIPTFDEQVLVSAIRTDQAGQSTFPEFMFSAWKAGVTSYEADFFEHTVTYLGVNGEKYIEKFPAVEVTGLNFQS